MKKKERSLRRSWCVKLRPKHFKEYGRVDAVYTKLVSIIKESEAIYVNVKRKSAER